MGNKTQPLGCLGSAREPPNAALPFSTCAAITSTKAWSPHLKPSRTTIQAMLCRAEPETAKKDTWTCQDRIWVVFSETVCKEPSERHMLACQSRKGTTQLPARFSQNLLCTPLAAFPLRMPWLFVGVRKRKTEIKGEKCPRGSGTLYHQDRRSLNNTTEQITPDVVT